MAPGVKRRMDKVDALTLRERVIGFVLVLAGVFLLWESVAFAPTEARRVERAREMTGLREQVADIDEQVQLLAAQRLQDPDAGNRKRLAALRGEVSGMRGALARLLGNLVPPREMARVLEAVLTRETGLRLVKLEGLGAELIAGRVEEVPASAETPDANAQGVLQAGLPDLIGQPVTLYRHGLRVEFEGGYLDTLAYLKAVEALPWRFLWQEVRIEVQEHPRSTVSITVYSMSLQDDWIGV